MSATHSEMIETLGVIIGKVLLAKGIETDPSEAARASIYIAEAIIADKQTEVRETDPTELELLNAGLAQKGRAILAENKLTEISDLVVKAGRGKVNRTDLLRILEREGR